MLMKTGECFYREEDGSLWQATSYVNPDTGRVMSIGVFIEAAKIEEPEIIGYIDENTFQQ
jgi:hypothetical protein